MTLHDAAYRNLVEGITDYAIFWLERDGSVATWNAGATKATGYPADAIVGRPFSTLFPPEELGADSAPMLLARATAEKRWEQEGWLLRQDGSRFWAQTLVDAVTEGDTVIGFGVVMRDRSERKRVEKDLHDSQEQFRILVQGVADYAIYMLDPLGHVSSWNVGAERIKGYTQAEVVGRHYSTFYTPDDVSRDEPNRNLAAAMREGRLETEGWRQRKDGSRFWAHVVIDRINDSGGSLIGFAKITRDVTDRRAAALALEEAREALFQSQKLEAIGQLTGGVAHDFNNLLMAVQGNLELIREAPETTERLTRLVANALTGVRRGVSLTQRMLAFARRQQLNLEPVSIMTMVAGMSDLLRTSLGPAIAIETSFPLSLSPVLGDVNQLELCILNLCVNARDAMPDGGVIQIAARAEDTPLGLPASLTPGRYVSLSISDAGAGMDAATLGRATEPFFTTKGVGKGTGLGLSMVHGIAQQSGGTLAIESNVGSGTRVTMYLPVAVGDMLLPGERHALESVPAMATAAGMASANKAVVLVVDDDPLVLSTAVEMLRYTGFDTHGAGSAREALECIGRLDDLSVVVTDHAMPGMSGAELAEHLASARPDLRVIIASGYAELPGIAPAGTIRLQKPFGRDALLEAIRGTG